MKFRNLGKSGLRVSEIGLGANNFGGRIDLEASTKVIHKSLDVGITLIDTADIYGNAGGSEEIIGKVLKDRRKDIVLATKFGMQMGPEERKRGASRRYIISAVEDSLRRLQTDWIDLYQLHTGDPLTPIEETLRTLDDLVRQGKVRYIGCSNLPAWQVVDSLWTSKSLGIHSFASCQDEFSLLVRDPERELVPAIEAHGLGLLPYFPLASGLLTGKYKGGNMPEGARITNSPGLQDRVMTARNLEIVAELERFASDRGHTLLHLAFGWLLSHRVVSSVIAGATKPEQVEANAAAGDWELSSDEVVEVGRIVKG